MRRETEKSLKKKHDATGSKEREKEPRAANGRQRRCFGERPARLNKEPTVAAALSDRPTIDPQ